MHPAVLFEHIMPNLSPQQIDDLQLTNRSLHQIISANRARFPGHPVNSVNLTADSKMDFCEISLQTTLFSIKTQTVKFSEVYQKLHSCEPEKLTISGSFDLNLLSIDWLKKIKKVYIDFFATEEEFEKFVKKLNCSTVFFNNLPNGCKGDIIVEKMRHVRKIHIPSVKMSPTFFNSIVEKSQEGPGIKLFEIMNTSGIPVEANALLHFVKNAKFDMCNAVIGFVKGSRDDFDEEMQALNERIDRDVDLQPGNVYKITGKDCSIKLFIRNFIDSR